MKNLILSLLFIAIGSFAFGKSPQTEKINFESKIVNVKTNKVMDLNTFMSKFDYKNIDKQSVTFDVMASTFNYIDGCGNSWTVTYSGMSFYDVIMLLFLNDRLLCAIADAFAATIN